MKVTRTRLDKIAPDFKDGYVAALELISKEVNGVMVMNPDDYQKVWEAYRKPEKIKGVGGLVTAILKPVAMASDKVLGTHLVGCPNCHGRAKEMDEALPI